LAWDAVTGDNTAFDPTEKIAKHFLHQDDELTME